MVLKSLILTAKRLIVTNVPAKKKRSFCQAKAARAVCAPWLRLDYYDQ